MLNVRLAGDHLFGKLLFTWLSLVMSMMVSFVLSFFPRDVLDEILNLIGSVSEGFSSYSWSPNRYVLYKIYFFLWGHIQLSFSGLGYLAIRIFLVLSQKFFDLFGIVNTIICFVGRVNTMNSLFCCYSEHLAQGHIQYQFPLFSLCFSYATFA